VIDAAGHEGEVACGMSETNGETGWPRSRIGDFARTCSGATPSRSKPSYYCGSIPWVKTGELRDGEIYDTEEHVSESALRETSLRLLPAGTLLVAMYGQGQTRGRTGLLMRPATTNQACFAILPDPQLYDTEYLQWWFRHNYHRLRQETESRGGNQPNLNGIFLRQQEVELPPLAEQQRIAAILKKQLAAFERARAAAGARLEAAKALPAAFLREILASAGSEGWPTRRLGELLTRIEAGKCVSCEERPATLSEWGVLKVSAVTWGSFKPEENKVLPADFAVPDDREVRVGDFLVSRSNTTELVGAVVHVRKTRPRLMLSDKTLRLVSRDDQILPEFMELALRSPQCRAFIEEGATGASSSMKNITQDTIRDIPLPVPPIDEQHRIMARVSKQLDATQPVCAASVEQLDAIDKMPTALLRSAFHGQM